MQHVCSSREVTKKREARRREKNCSRGEVFAGYDLQTTKVRCNFWFQAWGAVKENK
jgi:hypothetical protein